MSRKIIVAAACGFAALAFVAGCARPAPPAAPQPPTKEQAIEAFSAMYPDLRVREATATGDGWIVTGELPPPDSSYPGPIRARTVVHPGGSGEASATVAGITWYGDSDLSALSEVPDSPFWYPDTLGMAIAYIPAVDETHAFVTALRRTDPTAIDVTLANDVGRSWNLRFVLSPNGDWVLDENASDAMRAVEEERELVFIEGPEGRAMLAALRTYLERRLRQPLRLDWVSTETTQSWAQVSITPRRPNGKAVDYRRLKEFRAAIDAGDFDDGTQALMHKTRGRWRVVECYIGGTDSAWDSWGPFKQSDN